MDGEQKLIATFVLAAAAVLMTLCLSITYYQVKSAQIYTSSGYTQTTLPGAQGAVWTKR